MIEYESDGDTWDDLEQLAERTLPAAIEDEIVQLMNEGAQRAKAAPFLDDTGETRQSIQGGIFSQPEGGEKSWIGFIRAESVAAGFLEYGTKPHEIRPKNARRLAFQGPAGIVFATKVNHPGTRALQFISGALTEDEFVTRISRRFEKVMGTS